MADQEQDVSAPNPPPAPVQVGHQVQQHQQQQVHVAPQAQYPTAQQQGQQVVHFKLVLF